MKRIDLWDVLYIALVGCLVSLVVLFICVSVNPPAPVTRVTVEGHLYLKARGGGLVHAASCECQGR